MIDQESRLRVRFAEILATHVVLLAILGWVMWESFSSLSERDRAVPAAVAAVAIVALLYNAIRQPWLRKKPEAQPAMGESYGTYTTEAISTRQILAVVGFVAFVFLTPVVGIYVATIGLVLGFSILLRVHVLTALGGLVVAVGLLLVFDSGLGMNLP
jgi:Co/Zn/Cd efflux system component